MISWNVEAQINTNGNTTNIITGENPFIDLSSFSDPFGVPINQGKGLYFPRTDLTSWTFITSNMSDTDFMTGFDGMIVYNSGTGNTVAGQGQVVAVTPGFYFFSNPTIVIGDQPTITSGQWESLGSGGSSGPIKIDDLTDAKSDNDGTDNGSSIFFGINAGAADDGANNSNVGIGYNTFNSAISSYASVAIGYEALTNLTTEDFNTAMGFKSLTTNTGGAFNTAVGAQSLQNLSVGHFNTALGTGALSKNLVGSNNVAVGHNAMSSGVNLATGSASNNVGIGVNVFATIDTGNYNTGLGYNAGNVLTTGSNNTLLGTQASDNITTGSNNITIGYKSEVPSATGDNQLTIGNLIYGTGVDGTDATISTGNIGIGVKAPSEKLEVDGNIYASGGGALLTDTGIYADYVFDGYNNNVTTLNKDYTFKTLTEVEAFIKLNSHLPGVTGIKELEKTANGYKVNITALSGQLLEKVEELFLHTIAQQSAIEELRQKNINLSQENTLLKQRLDKIESVLGINN